MGCPSFRRAIKLRPMPDKDLGKDIQKTESTHESPRESSLESRRDLSPETRFLVPMSAMLAGRRWRLTARAIGLAFFIAGAALIVWVFFQAFSGFAKLGNSNYLQSEINKIGGDGWQLITVSVSVVGGEILRLLYLLLLGLLGSMIAGKGIQFFAASESVIDEAVVGLDEEIN